MPEIRRPAQTKKTSIKSKAKDKTKSQFTGFAEFLRSQGVVGLAIGFIIGTQAKVLVDQFNDSFINPILGFLVGGGEDLSKKAFTVHIGTDNLVFEWGLFAFVFINFVITAAIIYFVFKWLRLDKLDKKKD